MIFLTPEVILPTLFALVIGIGIGAKSKSVEHLLATILSIIALYTVYVTTFTPEAVPTDDLFDLIAVLCTLGAIYLGWDIRKRAIEKFIKRRDGWDDD